MVSNPIDKLIEDVEQERAEEYWERIERFKAQEEEQKKVARGPRAEILTPPLGNVLKYGLHRNNRLPPLSWMLTLSGSRVDLECGRSVEVNESGFFEGAWAGSFHSFDFDTSASVFGSGGKLTSEGWLVVPPSHTLDAVYIFKTGSGWLASNSLAFLLTDLDASIKVAWPETLIEFVKIIDGLRFQGCVSTTAGVVAILRHHNAVLGENLQLRPKPTGIPFSGFNDYKEYLFSTLRATAQNVCDSSRQSGSYTLTATVSTGYDSAAGAALAKAAGCQEAFAIARTTLGENDDGSQIAQTLGLRVMKIDNVVLSNTIFDDADKIAEFLATGMLGDDLPFIGFGDKLSRRLLVTGFHGDAVWGLSGAPSTEIVRHDVSGSSLGEFRLHCDFIHLPLPFVGACQHPSIQKISMSNEMDPYRIGGNYDRPVPRRIVEEAGVARLLFGQTKKAATPITLFWPQCPAEVSREVKKRIDRQPFVARALYRVRALRWVTGMLCHTTMRPLARSLPPSLRVQRIGSAMQWLLIRYRWRRFIYLHPFGGYATQWALIRVGLRYQSARLSGKRSKSC